MIKYDKNTCTKKEIKFFEGWNKSLAEYIQALKWSCANDKAVIIGDTVYTCKRIEKGEYPFDKSKNFQCYEIKKDGVAYHDPNLEYFCRSNIKPFLRIQYTK